MARWVEALTAALLTAVVYVALYAQTPIDDTLGHSADIAAGKYRWQAAHLLMQPATVLWHRYFGGNGTALASQHHINTASAAVGMAILMLLLRRLNVATLPRWLILLIALASYNLLMLGTSGHMKLVAFPPLAAALYFAVAWEQRLAEGRGSSAGLLGLSALCLAVASLCLANSIVVAPLMALAIACTERGARRFTMPAAYLAIAVGLTVAGLYAGYVSTQAEPHTAAGFQDFVFDRARGRHNPLSIQAPIRLARAAYAVALNFVYTGELGTVVRARLIGQIDNFAGYGAKLARGAVPLAVLLLVLLPLYLASLRQAWRRSATLVTAWAFLLAAVLFGAYWNLSEAEFYFQATLPTLVMAGALWGSGKHNLWLVVWLAAELVCNVGLWAYPRQQYPFRAYTAEWQEALKSNDLVVCFDAYAGRPSMGLFWHELRDKPHYSLDTRLKELGREEHLLDDCERRIDEALAAGGRVYVVSVLDEQDWNAPWPILARFNLTKQELRRFFEQHWVLAEAPPRAELPVWELTRKP